MTTRERRPFFDEESRLLDRFGLLLLLTVSSIVVLSLTDLAQPTGNRARESVSLGASAITALTLLVALRAAGLARRWQRVADALILVGLLSSGLLIAFGVGAATTSDRGTAPVLAVTLAILAPIVVVRRLLMHRRVKRATLMGAFAAYLLIPVAYFYIFLSVDLGQDGSFFGQPEPTSSLMYFSLTTITTVGYGDLVAVSQPGRLLANSLAVIGQVYLVTFVGLLIGILTQQNRDR